jgi:hypothetical protein
MEMRRVSMVIWVDSDEKTAENIQDATEAFVKTNYKNVVKSVEKHFRTVFVRS